MIVLINFQIHAQPQNDNRSDESFQTEHPHRITKKIQRTIHRSQVHSVREKINE